MKSGGVEPREDVVLAAKAALEDVTESPWEVNRDGWATISSGSDSVFHGYFDGFCNDCGEQLVENASVAISIEDAEFIAAARSLVPELVAELETVRSEARALRSQVIDSDSAIAASERYLSQEVAENERLRRQPGCCCGGCVL